MAVAVGDRVGVGAGEESESEVVVGWGFPGSDAISPGGFALRVRPPQTWGACFSGSCQAYNLIGPNKTPNNQTTAFPSHNA
jgi:hypothetical protein